MSHKKLPKAVRPTERKQIKLPEFMGLPKELGLLLEMYRTSAPSFNEEGMAKIVLHELNKARVTYNVDEHWNIFNLQRNTPLVCAHMDQVGKVQVDCIFTDGKTISGTHNLGADDKNGVWICLQLIKKFKNKISFIFSTGEESGGNIQHMLVKYPKVLKTIKYGLVFDRKGGEDFIGWDNGYCTQEFEDRLEDLSKKYGFPHSACKGVFSDCNKLKEYMSCVNISCGYQEAHTDKEYTIIDDLYIGLRFGETILKDVRETFDKYDPPKHVSNYSRNYHGYGGSFQNNRVAITPRTTTQKAPAITRTYVSQKPKQANLPGVPNKPSDDKESHTQFYKRSEEYNEGERHENAFCPSCFGNQCVFDSYTQDFICKSCLRLHPMDDLLDNEGMWEAVDKRIEESEEVLAQTYFNF